MSIWDTIATAPPPGGGGNYFRRGDYVVTVLKAQYRKSHKPGGGELVICEFRVDQVLLDYQEIRGTDGKVLSGEEGSNKEGETISWVRNLTKNPEMAPGDVRAFVAAALDVGLDDLTSSEIKAALDGDGTFLTGTYLHVHAWPKEIVSRPGKFFTKCQFTNMESWEEEDEDEDED